MRFEHANLLWLLLVIPPVLALFFWWGERVRRRLLPIVWKQSVPLS